MSRKLKPWEREELKKLKDPEFYNANKTFFCCLWPTAPGGARCRHISTFFTISAHMAQHLGTAFFKCGNCTQQLMDQVQIYEHITSEHNRRRCRWDDIRSNPIKRDLWTDFCRCLNVFAVPVTRDDYNKYLKEKEQREALNGRSDGGNEISTPGYDEDRSRDASRERSRDASRDVSRERSREMSRDVSRERSTDRQRSAEASGPPSPVQERPKVLSTSEVLKRVSEGLRPYGARPEELIRGDQEASRSSGISVSVCEERPLPACFSQEPGVPGLAQLLNSANGAQGAPGASSASYRVNGVAGAHGASGLSPATHGSAGFYSPFPPAPGQYAPSQGHQAAAGAHRVLLPHPPAPGQYAPFQGDHGPSGSLFSFPPPPIPPQVVQQTVPPPPASYQGVPGAYGAPQGANGAYVVYGAPPQANGNLYGVPPPPPPPPPEDRRSRAPQPAGGLANVSAQGGVSNQIKAKVSAEEIRARLYPTDPRKRAAEPPSQPRRPEGVPQCSQEPRRALEVPRVPEPASLSSRDPGSVRDPRRPTEQNPRPSQDFESSRTSTEARRPTEPNEPRATQDSGSSRRPAEQPKESRRPVEPREQPRDHRRGTQDSQSSQDSDGSRRPTERTPRGSDEPREPRRIQESTSRASQDSGSSRRPTEHQKDSRKAPDAPRASEHLISGSQDSQSSQDSDGSRRRPTDRNSKTSQDSRGSGRPAEPRDHRRRSQDSQSSQDSLHSSRRPREELPGQPKREGEDPRSSEDRPEPRRAPEPAPTKPQQLKPQDPKPTTSSRPSPPTPSASPSPPPPPPVKRGRGRPPGSRNKSKTPMPTTRPTTPTISRPLGAQITMADYETDRRMTRSRSMEQMIPEEAPPIRSGRRRRDQSMDEDVEQAPPTIRAPPSRTNKSYRPQPRAPEEEEEEKEAPPTTPRVRRPPSRLRDWGPDGPEPEAPAGMRNRSVSREPEGHIRRLSVEQVAEACGLTRTKRSPSRERQYPTRARTQSTEPAPSTVPANSIDILPASTKLARPRGVSYHRTRSSSREPPLQSRSEIEEVQKQKEQTRAHGRPNVKTPSGISRQSGLIVSAEELSVKKAKSLEDKRRLAEKRAELRKNKQAAIRRGGVGDQEVNVGASTSGGGGGASEGAGQRIPSRDEMEEEDDVMAGPPARRPRLHSEESPLPPPPQPSSANYPSTSEAPSTSSAAPRAPIIIDIRVPPPPPPRPPTWDRPIEDYEAPPERHTVLERPTYGIVQSPPARRHQNPQQTPSDPSEVHEYRSTHNPNQRAHLDSSNSSWESDSDHQQQRRRDRSRDGQRYYGDQNQDRGFANRGGGGRGRGNYLGNNYNPNYNPRNRGGGGGGYGGRR